MRIQNDLKQYSDNYYSQAELSNAGSKAGKDTKSSLRAKSCLSGLRKPSVDYNNPVAENSVKRSRMQTLLNKEYKKKTNRDDSKSVRSAFNSHRPSTSNRIHSRLSQRGGEMENKQLDIENYIDSKIENLSKNQI